jgi:protein-S-isoprenylcysteine O-methyltransferase Ste14
MSEFAERQPAQISRSDRSATGIAAGVSAPAAISQSRLLTAWLANPWVDKALAILAVSPFAYPIVMHFRHHLNIWEMTYLAQTLVLIATMVIRRPPVRISTNPFYWVVAIAASYWGLLILSVEDPGRRLVASWTVLLLYPLGVFMDVWGRLSLGRNIGVLPAQREIVDRGAYRWVRHPIYTAVFLMVIAGMLRTFSAWNLLLYSLAVILFVARTLAEEEFLRTDSAYSAYMRRVHWRWFPGIF